MDKKIRILAGAIITESKLSKEAKLQLLNFIENEATDIQIKALLLDGKILPTIDSQTEENINNRFSTLEFVEPLMYGAAVSVFLVLVTKAIYQSSKRILTKSGRACKDYTGNEHTKCVNKFKVEAFKKELALLQQAKSKCNKTKEPKKCVSMLDKKAEKVKTKLGKIRL